MSNGQALLLAADANTRLYFQANANFNGNVTDAVTFRAWDQTTGTAGTKVDTAVNGGSTAYSSATDTANITVSAVNDNPVATNDVLWVSNSTNVTLSLSTLLGNDTDADGLALSITSFSAAAGQFHDESNAERRRHFLLHHRRIQAAPSLSNGSNLYLHGFRWSWWHDYRIRHGKRCQFRCG